VAKIRFLLLESNGVNKRSGKMLGRLLIIAAAISIGGFSTHTASAQDGPSGFTTLSGLGCGAGHVARVNDAGVWECSIDLTTVEGAAAAAQTTADGAATDATAAQSTADGAVIDAANAQSTATTAVGAAAAAQSTADGAATAAGTAQSTANGAAIDAAAAAAAAATAQSAADAAASAASAAQSTADGAAGAASAAQSTANEASARIGVLEGQDLNNRISVLESAAPGPGGDPFLVDCATDTIGAALAAGATNIIVSGLCDENLNITTSNVTITGENLDGGNPDDGIDTGTGPGYGIRVSGAQNVNLIDLKIIGGRNGLNVSSGAAAFVTNSEIEPATNNIAGNRLGVFVGDQAFFRLNESVVIDGGILASRAGVVRLVSTDVTGDDVSITGRVSINLFAGSVANIFGGTFNGLMFVNSNSVVQVRSDFLSTNFGPTVVNSLPSPAVICQNFSNIVQLAGSLEDASNVALTETDIVVAEIAPNVPGCTLNGFAP
jgi:hypothetical protein